MTAGTVSPFAGAPVDLPPHPRVPPSPTIMRLHLLRSEHLVSRAGLL